MKQKINVIDIIIKKLDKVASKVEGKGLIKEAFYIDKVSDLLENNNDVIYGRSPKEIKENRALQWAENVFNLNKQLLENKIDDKEQIEVINNLKSLWRTTLPYVKALAIEMLPLFFENYKILHPIIEQYLKEIYFDRYVEDRPELRDYLDKMGVK
jgi:hypothetical protein